MFLNPNAARDVWGKRSGPNQWPGEDRGRHTVIRADLTVIGDLLTDGHIEVEGTVKGIINGQTVTVGESGRVEGSVLAESAYICGSVTGPIMAKNVRIGKAARVIGTIFHTALIIEPGAYLDGRRPWRPHIERKLDSA